MTGKEILWAFAPFALTLTLVSVLLSPTASAQGSDAPLDVRFQKCYSAAIEGWTGSVSGDISGALVTTPTEIDDSQPVWRVRFVFEIDAGPESMTIDLDGTLNSETGRVVMNGAVASGYLAGARVQEQGQMTDAENQCFEGTIRITPSS